MEIVEDFDEKSYNNNGKLWKSSRIFRLNPMFFHLSFFFHHFSTFFPFSFFHFFFFFIFSFLLILNIFIFFHFLSFSLSLLGAQNLIFFRASISLRFLLTGLM